MPATKQFPYSQLDKQNEFRLLHLLPASHYDDDIRCRLTCSFIGGSGSYEALSYTWGTPNDTLSICVDDHPLNITVNLAAALRRLRLLDTERVLWVDAICINQADLDEKGWAVPRMHEIYSYADKVIVWLGEAGDLSNLALDLVQNAAAVNRKADGAELNEVFKLENASQPTKEEETLQRSTDESRRSLDLLFKRAWWSRVWVVQEVAFSKSCTVLCGSREVDWQDFVDSFSFIVQTLHRDTARGTSKSLLRMKIIGCMEEFRKIVMDHSASSLDRMIKEKELLRILITLRDFEATDPRDHVYAGLSLIYSFGSMGIFPILNLDYEPGLCGFWRANYEKDTAQVFAAATMFVSLIFDDLKFLNLVEPMMEEKDDPTIFTEIKKPTMTDFPHLQVIYDSTERRTCFRLRTSPEQRTETDDASVLESIDGYKRVVIPRLPSWVPNWAQRRLSCPVPGDYDMPEGEGFCPYRASGSLKKTASFVHTSDGVLCELKIKAEEFGTVSVVGDDFYGCDPENMFVEAAGIVVSTDQLLMPTGQSPREALLRTFVGDRNADHTLPQEINGDSVSNRARQFALGKRFMVVDGFIGLGPRATRAGDSVYIIPGCHVPVIVREKTLYGIKIVCSKHDDTGNCAQFGCVTRSERDVIDRWHQVIGGAYVHGIMNGEAAGIMEEHPERLEELHLR